MVTYRDGQTIGSQWRSVENRRDYPHGRSIITKRVTSPLRFTVFILSFPFLLFSFPFSFSHFFVFRSTTTPLLSLSFSCGILDWKVEVSRATPSRQLWRPPRDVSCAYPHETGAGAIVGNVQLKMNEPMGSESAPLDRSQPRLKRDRRMIVT